MDKFIKQHQKKRQVFFQADSTYQIMSEQIAPYKSMSRHRQIQLMIKEFNEKKT